MRLAYLDDALAHGEHERLEPRIHPELAEDAHEVVAHRADTDVELLGDLLVAQAVGERLQDPLSRGVSCWTERCA